jgi:Tol biopolymer transport system component
MRVDGSGQKQLTKGAGRDVFPEWSPDGAHIAFIRIFPKNPEESSSSDPHAVMVMNADGSNLRPLTKRKVGYGSPSVGWAPNGKRLLYTDSLRRRANLQALFVVRLRDKDRRRVLVGKGGPLYEPDWAPDSEHIIFGWQKSYESDVYRVRSNGRGQRKLTGNRLISSEGPVWSPRGKRIGFVGNENGCRSLVWTMNADGSGKRNLLQGRDLQVTSLDW